MKKQRLRGFYGGPKGKTATTKRKTQPQKEKHNNKLYDCARGGGVRGQRGSKEEEREDSRVEEASSVDIEAN